MHAFRAILSAFIVFAACSLRAAPVSIAQTQTDISVAPGFNHAAIRVGITYGGNTAAELQKLSVTSDSSWVSATVDTNSPALVLTFTTGALINRTYTATLTVSDGTDSAQTFVRATVAQLNVTKLADDPVRSRTYAVQQDGVGLGSILVFDPLTLNPVANVTVGNRPADMAISADGNEMLVICSADKRIVAIDLRTLRVTESIPLTDYVEWDATQTSANVAYGPNDIIYYSDGAWGPVLHVLKRSTRTTLQNIFVDGSAYAGAGNATHGFGDIVVSPDKTALYGWSQYGWSAGALNTWPAKFTIAADGKLTLASGATYKPSLNRDPLTTPALLSADGKTLFVKEVAVATADVTKAVRTFPAPVFSMTPGGEIVATSSAIYEYATGNKVYDLPATSTVQAITSDYARLVYFDSTAKALKSVNLFDKVGATILKRDSSPANQAIVLPPSELRWTPVSGVDRYRVYLGESQSAVTQAGPASPESLGLVTGSSVALSQTLTAGKTYYWRVDVVTDSEVVAGQVQSFTVSSIAASVSSFDVATVRGHSDYALSVDLSSSPAGRAWSASSPAAWVKIANAQGTTPATLRFSLDASALTPGVVQTTIKVTTPEGAFTIPIRLQVDPLALTVIRSSPRSALVYAISEYTPPSGSQAAGTRAYLLEIDSQTQAIKRVVPVGSSATDLAIHFGDNRIYVTNWMGGSLLALGLNSLALERTYAFKPFAGMGYGEGDAYRVAAGGPGRLLVEEEDQWIDISLYDTAAGAYLGKAYVREGGGQYAPDLRYYYHGENNSSGAELRKFDTLADTLTDVAHSRGNISSYYGSRTVVVSEDGSRIFWSGSVFKPDLTEEWPMSDIVYCVSRDGQYAFAETKIYDVANRKVIFGMPVATKVSAFNTTTNKLVVQQDQRIAFFALSTSGTLPAPVLSIDSATATSLTLKWVEDALQSGFTLQMRSAGTTAWNDVPATLSSTISTYTVTGLTAETTYEFRLKADAATSSSGWSNVASGTTLPAPPNTPSYSVTSAGPTSALVKWSVSGTYDSVTIERTLAYTSPTVWTTVATLDSPTTTYTDTGLTTGVGYSYRLKATRRGSDSPYTYTQYITLQPAAAPTFTSQPPQSTTVMAGKGVTFYVSATGNPPPTFQWYHDGVAIPGATNSNLTISSPGAQDAGTYTVIATNTEKAVTSNAITLTVTPSTSRLVNASVLADVSNGSILTVGFGVAGGPKNVLVRGLGPTLSAVGVAGVLSDPQMTVFRHGGGGATPILSNNDWSSAYNRSSLLYATSRLTGLPFIADPSRDCAVLALLNFDGGYSVQLSSADGGSGLALVELYDADSDTPSRLSNISALTQVGPGRTLTAGFVITGSTKKRVLIRAVGPTLTALSVANPLADPKLTVYRQSATPLPIATSDDWSTAANRVDVAAAASATGAFGLPEGSKDAALLLDFDPGEYSAQVTSGDGSTGPALVEVYDVP
jgi:hypothetical protein